MKAIISDILSNLEALQAVLDDIAAQGVREIYCLGNLVGFGPNPCECIDLLMNCQVVLLGNNDLAATGGETPAIPTAIPRWHQSNLRMRRQLAIPGPDHDHSRRRREFLAGLPQTHREGDYLFLHGSPRNPVNEFVFPEDVHNERKMQRVFSTVERYCFMGKTHIPGIFTEDIQFIAPEMTGGVWRLDGRKTLCNVGSVGRPRNGEARACYVLLGDDTVRFRRVDYDIETTLGKLSHR